MQQDKKTAGDLKKFEDQELKETVKQIGLKTFYKIGDRWVNASYKDGHETIKVQFLSDDYWQLLKEHPEIAKWQSIGIKMVIVLKDRVIEIVES